MGTPTMLAGICVALAVICAGCVPVVQLDGEQLTTVDYWPEQHLLFVGSPQTGVIDVLRVPSTPRQASLAFVERLTHPSRRQVLRVVVDRTKGRLWAADQRALYMYQYLPRGEEHRIPFSKGEEKRVSDFVIDVEGSAYVLVADGAEIFRVSSKTLAPEKWLQTAYPMSQGVGLSRTRALITKDARYVLFQSPTDRGLVRVHLQSKQLEKIKRGTPLSLDCVTFLWNDAVVNASSTAVTGELGGDSLSAFHCYGRWIGQISLDRSLSQSREGYLWQSQ